MVESKIAVQQAKNLFIKNPISASLSGLGPRLLGVRFKRVLKFGFLWSITHVTGGSDPGMISAVGASIFSAYCINPIRMIEKHQRIDLNTTGKVRSVIDILKEARSENYKPLFRGTVPLMGHSVASATTGLVGQPTLQKHIENMLVGNNLSDNTLSISKSSANLIALTIVSPIYVFMTNPISRLEVIMQTSSIKKKGITLTEALKELFSDSKNFGLKGAFRGQGIGMIKANISLSLFHEGRMFSQKMIKKFSQNGLI